MPAQNSVRISKQDQMEPIHATKNELC